jgi:hypothetical protein
MSDLVEGDFVTIKPGSYLCAKHPVAAGKVGRLAKAEQTRLVSLYIFRQTAPVCRRAGGLVRIRARKAPRGAGDALPSVGFGTGALERSTRGIAAQPDLVRRALK